MGDMEKLSSKVHELEHQLAETSMEVREVREDVREMRRLLEAFLSNKEMSPEGIANTNRRRPDWAEARSEQQIAAPTAVVNSKDQRTEDETVKSPLLARDDDTNIIVEPAECAPLTKAGGLGNVAGALLKALAQRGHKVMFVAPPYGNYTEIQETGVCKRCKVEGQDIEGLSVKMVAAGAEHTAAITEDGKLYGWGWGRYGNLGLGDRKDRLVPAQASSVDGERMVLVACGWRHTISVSSSGALYTYGWSKYGQLGHGDFEDHLVPHQLEALRNDLISQISGGWRHTMALTSDGKLYGWGWNKFGQVGVGDNVDHCSPVQVKFPDEQKVVQISCGWRHTLAVTERQNVFSWGRGTNGQLGHGDPLDRNVPKLIEALSADGTSCQQIPSSKVEPLSGKIWVSPSERYAIVPDETSDHCSIVGQGQTTVPIKGNGSDASVPENDVKRMRF